MAENPLFTAIVHTYNRPAYLKQAVGALRQQTYADLEIILINNGGTPETIEYLHQIAFSDDRVKLINFEENIFSWDDSAKYVQICWNTALAEATGDYVWIQEDDDLIADDYAEKMVALFQENPDCTSAAGLMVGIDEAGNRVAAGPRDSNFRSRYMPGHLLALDYLRGGKTVFAAPGTVFTFKRDALIAAGGYHRSITLSHLYGIVPFGVTGFDETALCYWRYHPGAVNQHTTAKGYVGIDETDSLLKEWDIERRWQVHGKGVAIRVVSHIENHMCETAAQWFCINLSQWRITACLRILRKMWTRRRFWWSMPSHAIEVHPGRRWLRTIAKQVFQLWPGLANMSPRLATLRDRINL